MMSELKDCKTIAKALRCSATPWSREKEKNCDSCPYQSLELVDKELGILPDVEVDGIGYWRSCDTDAMALDAAWILEGLPNG